MLEVIKPGVSSTIQDLGRFNAAQYGLSQGGPADLHAFCWGNFLLGNPTNAAQIEITNGGFQALSHCEGFIAVTGAAVTLTINGVPLPTWSAHKVKIGDQLKLSHAKQGNFAYLAVSGGFDTPRYLDSRATVSRNRAGGVNGDGASLNIGDKLRWDQVVTHIRPPLSRFQIPDYLAPLTLRLVPGYQFEDFAPDAIKQLLHELYYLSPKSNRMGYTLQGEPIATPQLGIISEGIALGSVQVPPSGQPIILLNDRQSIGGYPKLGTICKIDLPRLAQYRFGQPVRFSLISRQMAAAKLLKFHQFFNL
uniref:5-oxoprolinase subunit C family protein n=1 Tax=Thaumasiovibrio occultus TaxID=1891184 RepID=UPI00131E5F75|nr:biotin-dependent carboxyltransferase family protein [Thaumasiovibrio occultus]